MSQRPAEKMSDTRTATESTLQPRKQLLILVAVLACTFIVLVAAAWALLAGPAELPKTAQSPPVQAEPQPATPTVVAEKKSPPQPNKPAKKAAAPKFAADIKPLWESPTNGPPLNLG